MSKATHLRELQRISLHGGYLHKHNFLPNSQTKCTQISQVRSPRCHFLILLIQFVSIISNQYIIPIIGEDETGVVRVDVGTILDLETDVAKVMHTCILIALEDYHAAASRSAVRIVHHLRDSKMMLKQHPLVNSAAYILAH
ncbi:uncharacterized protein LOC132617843 [Lycium barbarum]|uniref:uncharacterized protein LOC132617843 n=1 Tax=Lycium barbarum TaxID=112863 RepID=UPI00293E043F|nr:uncharacterized protein LOC132617843 [Lycium barbarum]